MLSLRIDCALQLVFLKSLCSITLAVISRGKTIQPEFSIFLFGSKLEGGKPAEEATKYWVKTSKAAYPPFPSKTISCQNMASINLKVPAAKKWGVEEGRDTFFRKPLAWGGADRGREKEKEIGDIGLQKKERRRRKRRGKK